MVTVKIDGKGVGTTKDDVTSANLNQTAICDAGCGQNDRTAVTRFDNTVVDDATSPTGKIIKPILKVAVGNIGCRGQ